MYEYDLFAVINHEGQINNGHYTNYARFQDEARNCCIVSKFLLLMDNIQWYRFDDDK
jgi:ubiquitin carboxyl-terminal hydrolase 22/27/51